LKAAGLSDVTGLITADSVAARTRALRSHGGPGPSADPGRGQALTRGPSRRTAAKNAPIFARPRRVAILPVRNGSQRPELAATARKLADSLKATLVAAGYTPVSDADLLQFMALPDISSQRRLADSIGVGAVITSILTSRGDEALAQSLVLDVWRGYPISARAAADIDKPMDALAVIRDVVRALERVSWRSRTDPKRVVVFDLDNQTGIDTLDAVARQLTTELRSAIVQRLGAAIAADSQSAATKDILERRAVGARLGAGAILAGSIYRARGPTVMIRLSIRDMSDDHTLPNIDAQVPRDLIAQQFGSVIEAVIAQLGQVNWGPRESR
jgi:TolB-like protein